MKNSPKDWLLLAVNLLFVLTGLFLIRHAHEHRDFMIGLSCIIFFGIGVFVVTHAMWVRHRSQTHWRHLQTTLNPAVRLKINRLRIGGMYLAIIPMGILAFYISNFDKRWLRPWLIKAFSLIMILAGFIQIVRLALGTIGKEYLQFEKEGLRIGDHRGSMLLEWGNIREVLPTEYKHNQVIKLRCHDIEALVATAKGNSKKYTPQGIMKKVKSTRTWLGCDWMILTGMYGVNATLLAKSIAAHGTDLKVRVDLENYLELNASKKI